MDARTILLLGLGLVAPVTYAHTMWINLAVDETEQHVVTSIGYGDFLPGSELLTTDWGEMRIVSYDLLSPDATRTSLGVPVIAPDKTRTLPSGILLRRGGDTGQRRIAFGGASAHGTYQVVAQSPLFRYIHYRDQQGEEHYTDQPLNSLQSVAEVLETSFDLYYMKTSFTARQWSDPAPVGQLLEIIPLTDLSTLQRGGTARFKVLLGGASNAKKSPAHVTAQSANFGDRWGLHSAVKYGEVEFRFPEAGLWRLDARVEGTREEFEIPGEALQKGDAKLPIYIQSTLVVHVRPG